jgi:hypothetical protein
MKFFLEDILNVILFAVEYECILYEHINWQGKCVALTYKDLQHWSFYVRSLNKYK